MANRIVKFYKSYFQEFYLKLSPQVQRKIEQTLVWIASVDRLPVSILKAIQGEDGLYEIRVIFAKDIFRIFCCFDKGNLIILFNGFQKKTQKTPKNEIKKAALLMQEYFNEQRNE